MKQHILKKIPLFVTVSVLLACIVFSGCAQLVEPSKYGGPEIRFAQIALVELRFVQLCALETCQLHLALGKHGAYDLVAV